MFNSSEILMMENLLPETKYNCTGSIVHSIPGAGDLDTLETPLADFVVVETKKCGNFLHWKLRTAINQGVYAEILQAYKCLVFHP